MSGSYGPQNIGAAGESPPLIPNRCRILQGGRCLAEGRASAAWNLGSLFFPPFLCVRGGARIRLAFDGGRDLIRGSTLGISPDWTGARISEHLAGGKVLVAPSKLIGGRSTMRKHRRCCTADAAKPVMCRDLIPARRGRSLGC